jgi:large subunit ribosomal protein L13
MKNKMGELTRTVKSSEITRNWYLVDAQDAVLGRISTHIAHLIQGKGNPTYSPNQNNGDKVVVINAESVRLTGNKIDKKEYIRHTGYPGGQRFTTPRQILAKHPEELIRMSVKNMLPKNKLQKDFMKNLYIYSGAEHAHEAQNPKKLDLKA